MRTEGRSSVVVLNFSARQLCSKSRGFFDVVVVAGRTPDLKEWWWWSALGANTDATDYGRYGSEKEGAGCLSNITPELLQRCRARVVDGQYCPQPAKESSSFQGSSFPLLVPSR